MLARMKCTVVVADLIQIEAIVALPHALIILLKGSNDQWHLSTFLNSFCCKKGIGSYSDLDIHANWGHATTKPVIQSMNSST